MIADREATSALRTLIDNLRYQESLNEAHGCDNPHRLRTIDALTWAIATLAETYVREYEAARAAVDRRWAKRAAASGAAP